MFFVADDVRRFRFVTGFRWLSGGWLVCVKLSFGRREPLGSLSNLSLLAQSAFFASANRASPACVGDKRNS
jgi:hypothetical protein